MPKRNFSNDFDFRRVRKIILQYYRRGPHRESFRLFGGVPSLYNRKYFNSSNIAVYCNFAILLRRVLYAYKLSARDRCAGTETTG